MGNLASARLSPEIVAAELRWYHGDTFTINFHLNLVDIDGERVELLPGDSVSVTLLDATRQPVDIGETVLDREQAIVTWELGRERSMSIAKGKYALSIVLCHDGEYRTILHESPVLVR